ncbi:MAG: HD domain-containing protein [Gemmatimonadetes bacterium]|uniref:HD domain-containing protein n=1 Tax=Candidatus Kutchimonas denitrificans TaxID=3056748 RepID=A0AAE4Z746_9BACT|nr:HD domain-containing protein [Gemmatimonadota bacterium]NIR73687.1 HD domain-containing protein [Candidatus Kutchimonas denitrificans]NIS00737.1 HD domain-containing protein [Gemmatimonadota bacterium]NIT66324.1 HD domain-containing protein [Gemmatimonadota bacterium]NIU51542.1 HD domain-containing protein [Gemmatimonadota bacterium]
MTVIRDPIWANIWIEPPALELIDAPAFQRLRRVKQLGLAYLVYPGAVHTRFDHALGVYHLTGRALRLLGEQGELDRVSEGERSILRVAGLLHDIGHYPFSHTVEELETGLVPADHEELAGSFLAEPEVAEALAPLGPDTAADVHALIQGRSTSPLQGLVSGSLDLDKIEYLTRDAHFCGVPYGEVDVDRLLDSLRLLDDPATGRREVGVAVRGVAALESLLFAKYQMFRNVYWHHAVRAASVVFQRVVREALTDGWASRAHLVGKGDEELLAELEILAAASDSDSARRALERLMPAIRHRRLPKRAAEWSGDALTDALSRLGREVAPWIHEQPGLRAALEDHVALELGLDPGCLFIDYPAKAGMLELDILMQARDGSVVRLTSTGRAGLIDLPRLGRDLYHAARVLRVFSWPRIELTDRDQSRILELVTSPADDVAPALGA